MILEIVLSLKYQSFFFYNYVFLVRSSNLNGMLLFICITYIYYFSFIIYYLLLLFIICYLLK